MDDITYNPQWVLSLFGMDITINYIAVIHTWIIMGALMGFSYLATRKTAGYNPFRTLAELIVTAFDNLVKDALEIEDYRKYFPLICGVFLFVFLSNIWGIVPHFSEPTKDLNTPLSLGIMGFIVAHYSGIRAKGIKKYLKEYASPIFLMAPLNVIGEIAKVVSISFRLYGNIMGGAIIIIVVSHLIYSLVLPPFLSAFFGLFVGSIQAFVFTMLTLVYISVQIK
jgi:F-type H+-transporting ATPase subunit a